MREGAFVDGAAFGRGVGEGSLESWFTEPKLPLGRFVKTGITWLQDNAAGFFDAVTATIDFLVDGSTAILLHVPFLAVVFALAALA
jgi:glycine betaine/proline transport system permease protein